MISLLKNYRLNKGGSLMIGNPRTLAYCRSAGLVFFVLFLSVGYARAQSEPQDLFIRGMALAKPSAAQSERIDKILKEPTTADLQVLLINTGALQGASARPRLPSEHVRTFLKQSVEKLPAEPKQGESFVWHGTLPEVPGTATLVVKGDNVTGTVQDGNDLYHIEPVGGGLHALVTIDTS